MRKLGYIWSREKSEEFNHQKEALRLSGCVLIYRDVVSSPKQFRSGFTELLSSVERGDRVVVEGLDRLGSSITQLLESVNVIRQRGGHLVSLSDNLDTSEDGTFYKWMDTLSMNKKRMNQERTWLGRQGTKARGRMGGRPSKLDEKMAQKAKKLYAEKEFTVNQICEILGISRPTLYKYVN